MSEFVLLKSEFGRIAVEVDADLVGFTAAGKRTQGGVRSVLVRDQVRADVKPASRPSAFAKSTEAAVREWLAGEISALDGIGVALTGTEFQQKVLRAMRKIKAGTVATYSELARQAGSPASVRAAGSVCARNRVPLIVPCHRVIKSDGTFGNYYYGSELKAALLAHEGVAR